MTEADENAGKTPAEDSAHAPAARRRLHPARRIALAGVYAALLIGGKEALAAIPNVEIVTLLCALGGYSFGFTSLPSVLAFVAVEGAIYGFGTWTVSYFIHWPLVTLAFILLRRLLPTDRKIAVRIVPTAIALLSVVCFSVLTSLADVGLLTGFFENFWARFGVYYLRGVPFYIAQAVTNAVVFPLLFPALARLLGKIYAKMFM